MCTALHSIPCPCPRLGRHQRRLQGLKPPTTPPVAPQDAGLPKSGGMAGLDLVQPARAGESSTKVARGLFWSCLWIPSNTGSLGALQCTEEEDPGPASAGLSPPRALPHGSWAHLSASRLTSHRFCSLRPCPLQTAPLRTQGPPCWISGSLCGPACLLHLVHPTVLSLTQRT